MEFKMGWIPRLVLLCWPESPFPTYTLIVDQTRGNGPLTRYVKLWVAHAPGMPGTFSSKKTAIWRSKHATRHVRHARAMMHVGTANPRWRGKRSRHFRCMRNPQFYVFGIRPMLWHSNQCSDYNWPCTLFPQFFFQKSHQNIVDLFNATLIIRMYDCISGLTKCIVPVFLL